MVSVRGREKADHGMRSNAVSKNYLESMCLRRLNPTCFFPLSFPLFRLELRVVLDPQYIEHDAL